MNRPEASIFKEPRELVKQMYSTAAEILDNYGEVHEHFLRDKNGITRFQRTQTPIINLDGLLVMLAEYCFLDPHGNRAKKGIAIISMRPKPLKSGIGSTIDESNMAVLYHNGKLGKTRGNPLIELDIDQIDRVLSHYKKALSEPKSV